MYIDISKLQNAKIKFIEAIDNMALYIEAPWQSPTSIGDIIYWKNIIDYEYKMLLTLGLYKVIKQCVGK